MAFPEWPAGRAQGVQIVRPAWFVPGWDSRIARPSRARDGCADVIRRRTCVQGRIVCCRRLPTHLSRERLVKTITGLNKSTQAVRSPLIHDDRA